MIMIGLPAEKDIRNVPSDRAYVCLLGATATYTTGNDSLNAGIVGAW
jgi:hypothetical protein